MSKTKISFQSIIVFFASKYDERFTWAYGKSQWLGFEVWFWGTENNLSAS